MYKVRLDEQGDITYTGYLSSKKGCIDVIKSLIDDILADSEIEVKKDGKYINYKITIELEE